MIYIVYPVPSEPDGRFLPQVIRFAESLRRNPPGVAYRLVLINSNGGLTDAVGHQFEPCLTFAYHGPGMDIGAQIATACALDPASWMLCFNTSSYLKKPGWLRPFQEATVRYGDGLYGSMASYEAHPHLRSTGYLCRAGTLASYSAPINDKRDCYTFEHGIDVSFGDRCAQRGMPVKLVTWDGFYNRSEWRKPPNVFRRGDQSNLLTFDRHTDLFDNASPEEQARLASNADTNT